MPTTDGLPKNVFAEYDISAVKPFFLWADNVGGASGSGFAFKGSYVTEAAEATSAAGFTPLPGHDYEIQYSLGEQGRELHLFEIVAGVRRPIEFDAGLTNCDR